MPPSPHASTDGPSKSSHTPTALQDENQAENSVWSHPGNLASCSLSHLGALAI